MYASSDLNIALKMFFELFLLRNISEFPSGTGSHNLMSFIEIQPTFSHLSPNSSMVRASRRRSEGCGFESRLGSLSKNSSKNIIMTMWYHCYNT